MVYQVICLAMVRRVRLIELIMTIIIIMVLVRGDRWDFFFVFPSQLMDTRYIIRTFLQLVLDSPSGHFAFLVSPNSGRVTTKGVVIVMITNTSVQ